MGFFIVVWALLLIAGRERMLRDPGTLWHTVVGQHMIDQGEFPRADAFSFTCSGRPWIAQQWLGELAMAAINRLAGLDGLLLVAVTLLALTFASLGERLVAAGLNWAATGLLLVLTIAAAGYHFHPRPHLITIILAAWMLLRLCDVEAGRRRLRSLWTLPVAFALWANVHGGVLGGILTAWVVFVGWAVVLIASGQRECRVGPAVAGMLMLGATSGAAVLLNPYGVELPRVWLALMDSPVLPKIISEHGPLEFRSVEGVMVLALAAIYLTVLLATWRRVLRVTWLVPLLWLALAVSRIRHAPIFALLAAVAIADMLPHSALPEFFRRHGSGLFVAPRPLAGLRLRPSALMAALVVLAVMLQAGGVKCPVIGASWATLSPGYWPVAATQTLADSMGRAGAAIPQAREVRVFNEMLFGGYLIYRLPRAKVFIDDRCELYGDGFLLDYLDLLRRPDRFDRAAEQWRFDFALVHAGGRLAGHLHGHRDWEALQEDSVASLFRRKGGVVRTASCKMRGGVNSRQTAAPGLIRDGSAADSGSGE